MTENKKPTFEEILQSPTCVIRIGYEEYIVDPVKKRAGYLLVPKNPDDLEIPYTYTLRFDNIPFVEEINDSRFEVIMEPQPGKLPRRMFISIIRF